MKKGFTLIELLVVVLIIGILASVALPQYEKAVEKSRAAGVWTMLSTLVKAGEAYRYANPSGGFINPEDLDVAIPEMTSCTTSGCSVPCPSSGWNDCTYSVVNNSETTQAYFNFFKNGNEMQLSMTGNGNQCCYSWGQDAATLCKTYGDLKITAYSSCDY